MLLEPTTRVSGEVGLLATPVLPCTPSPPLPISWFLLRCCPCPQPDPMPWTLGSFLLVYFSGVHTQFSGLLLALCLGITLVDSEDYMGSWELILGWLSARRVPFLLYYS